MDASILTKGFEFQVGQFTFAPAYWQAAAIVFLLFLLVITMAQVRRHFLDWSVKGASVGIFLGFLLALILEGFLLLSGNTIVTQVLGWKNAPKPIKHALDAGRSRLINVLGAEANATDTNEKVTYESIIQSYQKLPPNDTKKVRSTICTP